MEPLPIGYGGNIYNQSLILTNKIYTRLDEKNIEEFKKIRDDLLQFIKKHFPSVNTTHDDFFINEMRFLLKSNL